MSDNLRKKLHQWAELVDSVKHQVDFLKRQVAEIERENGDLRNRLRKIQEDDMRKDFMPARWRARSTHEHLTPQ